MTTFRLIARNSEPVPPGVEYHRVLAGDKRRIGRGMLAIVLLVAGLFAAIQVLFVAGTWLDGIIRPDRAPGSLSPITLAAGMIATALLIPWSMLIQRWLYGVRGASLHSVVSRFRFDIFGRALLLILPLFVIALAIPEYLEPQATVAWSPADLIGMFLVVILLVPLQSAGEEYGLRGLVFRVAGSWVHGRWASLVIGIAVSSVVFAVIHTALDPLWNLFYLVFSICTAIVTWRTGGLEIAVTFHAVTNVLTFLFWLLLGADLAERFDRSAVSPALVIPGCIAFVVVTTVVWLTTRRRGPATTPVAEMHAAG